MFDSTAENKIRDRNSVNFTLIRPRCSGLTKRSSSLSSTRAVSEICCTLGLNKSQLSSEPQQTSQHFVLSEVGKALKWVSSYVRLASSTINLTIIFHFLSDVTKQASRVYTKNRSTWLSIPTSMPTLLDIIFNSRWWTIVYYSSYIGYINTHTKGDGRKNHTAQWRPQDFANGGLKNKCARLARAKNFRPRPFPVTTPTIYGHAYGSLDGAHHELSKREL